MNFYQYFIEKYTALNNQLKCISLFLALTSTYALLFRFMPDLNWLVGSMLFFWGWFSWTFLEYIMHRFWWHGKEAKTETPMGERHQHHHTHPTDIKVTVRQRVILLLIVSALVIISLLLSIYLLIVAGFVFGFSWYTMMHWVLHQRWSVKFFPRLHRFHIYHHCKFPNSCYGVSVCWWDLVFKTVPPVQPVLVKRIIDFYFAKPPANRQ